jgi:hypothetical protein
MLFCPPDGGRIAPELGLEHRTCGGGFQKLFSNVQEEVAPQRLQCRIGDARIKGITAGTARARTSSSRRRRKAQCGRPTLSSWSLDRLTLLELKMGGGTLSLRTSRLLRVIGPLVSTQQPGSPRGLLVIAGSQTSILPTQWSTRAGACCNTRSASPRVLRHCDIVVTTGSRRVCAFAMISRPPNAGTWKATHESVLRLCCGRSSSKRPRRRLYRLRGLQTLL